MRAICVWQAFSGGLVVGVSDVGAVMDLPTLDVSVGTWRRGASLKLFSAAGD